ncbi:MAG TPA: putative dsRNA-binding protein, partial [Myxococcaceae bacterium]
PPRRQALFGCPVRRRRHCAGRTSRLTPWAWSPRGAGAPGGREKSSVLGDALEAVIGAVYLAGGMARVMEMVDRHFGEALAGVAEGRNGLDHKTILQEDAQERLRMAPRYRVISESGPDHDKTFEVEVVIGEEPYARASGKSKKEAEQAAARNALQRLGELPAKD